MFFSRELAGSIKKYAFPILLCLIVPAVLFPVLKNGFVDWDDMQYVVLNRALRGPWSGVFTFFPGYYHPVTILTYKLEFALFGLNPLPYHFVSLALHVVNCVSVFYLFKMLGARPGAAFIGALLFGIHPAHVEPVAWISGRKELLWGMFSFWALIAYLRYINGGGRKFTVYSLVFFTLAVLSKPTALVFPFIILLADHYRGREFNARLLAEKVPYLLIAAVGFMLSRSPSGFLLGGGGGVSFLNAAASAAQSALFYARKFAAPRALSALYPALDLPLSPGKYLIALFFAAVLIAAAFLISRRAGAEAPLNEGSEKARAPSAGRKIIFGLGYFFVAAFPGLILSPPADRYAYVPAAGLCFLYGELLSGFYGAARVNGGPPSGLRARFRAGAVVALAAAHFFILGASAFNRTFVWKDSLTLWEDVLSKYPLYLAFYGRGNARQAAGQYAGALADFTRCLELCPGYWKALGNRGRTFAEIKRFDDAISDYGKAIELNPASPQLFLNRGNAYFFQGNWRMAVKDYDMALAIAPDFPQAAENRRLAAAKIK